MLNKSNFDGSPYARFGEYPLIIIFSILIFSWANISTGDKT